MDDTIIRILNLIEKSEMSDKQILQKLDISNNSSLITDWRTGRSKSPQIKHIKKIAELFHVSTDYLLFGVKLNNELNFNEQEWLSLYEQLSEHDRIECTGFIKGYIAKEEKK